VFNPQELLFRSREKIAVLTPASTQFAVVSFEGPDEYSRAGGLAVRVRDLCETLEHEGFRTHLFFIGDPDLPSVEEKGNLILHRWSQWISAYHPGGVYDGEWGKLQDMAGSLPPFLIEGIIRPGTADGRVTVVMGEDWQTATAMIQLSQLAAAAGLAPAVIPVWTANNLYGFDQVDLPALDAATAILTVSRYMKHEMQQFGLTPLVTPNGISPSALVDVQPSDMRELRNAFGAEIALFKIGRYSPDKRWITALDAVALLKQAGARARILIRGDKLAYGQEVLARAAAQGLTVEHLTERYGSVADLAAAIASRPEADVLNLAAFLPDSLLPVIYAASDAVLANSGHEPFGLVGLEVMAAGGLAVVGSTGEDYAEPQRNAIVLDTNDPREIVVQLRRLQSAGDESVRIRQRGKETARGYIWPETIKELFAKLEFVALARGVEVPA
jgi:glycosyltransferase involved in cell wall biosynthesis